MTVLKEVQVVTVPKVVAVLIVVIVQTVFDSIDINVSSEKSDSSENSDT